MADNKQIQFSNGAFKKNQKRLVNQMWKLIPMREHGEAWDRQLDTVIIEIAGLNDLFNPQFLQLLSKLKGLQTEETNFDLYRKTIFECISLLQELHYVEL